MVIPLSYYLHKDRYKSVKRRKRMWLQIILGSVIALCLLVVFLSGRAYDKDLKTRNEYSEALEKENKELRNQRNSLLDRKRR